MQFGPDESFIFAGQIGDNYIDTLYFTVANGKLTLSHFFNETTHTAQRQSPLVFQQQTKIGSRSEDILRYQITNTHVDIQYTFYLIRRTKNQYSFWVNIFPVDGFSLIGCSLVCISMLIILHLRLSKSNTKAEIRRLQ